MSNSGCLGGQTGTEAAPNPSVGGAKSGGDTGAANTAARGNSAPSSESLDCGGNNGVEANAEDAGGVTEDAVIGFVNSSNPFTFHYPDGSSSSASLVVASSANACLSSPSSGPPSLNVPVSMQFNTEDARASFVLSGWVMAHAAADGGVSDAELTGSRQCDSRWEPPLSTCDIGELDSSRYASVRIDLSARIQLVAGVPQWLGNVRLSGSAAGVCIPQPCSTSDWVTVATMSMSNWL